MNRTFAPHFWSPESRTGTLFDRLSAQSIRDIGVTRYKVWLTHIQTNLPDAMLQQGIFTGEYRAKAIRFLRGLGLPVEVEVCFPLHSQLMVLMKPEEAISPVNIGLHLAKWHLETAFLPWLKDGGRIDYICIDGPFNKLLAGGMEQEGLRNWPGAMRAILSYMAHIRFILPSVRFIYLENLALWCWANYPSQSLPGGPCRSLGDLSANLCPFLRSVQTAVDRPKFDLVEIDYPFNPCFSKGSPGKLRSFVEAMQRIGLGCEFIVNSGLTAADLSGDHPYKKTVDVQGEEINASEVKQYALELKKMFGTVQGIVSQTWSAYPWAVLPVIGHSPLHSLAGNLAIINQAMK